MEAMEVDSPSAAAPYVISDSGSSTEVEEDEDDGAGAPLRLPSTWAFSQRAASSAPTSPATQGPPVRRRLRYQEAGRGCGRCCRTFMTFHVVPDRA